MNNSDSFEAIARDAVHVLVTIVEALRQNESAEAALTALVLAAQAEEFCDRALALGAE